MPNMEIMNLALHEISTELFYFLGADFSDKRMQMKCVLRNCFFG